MPDHTPGPWHVDVIYGRDESVFDKDGQLVAAHGAFHLITGRANARLIAAAPDMLAALERIYAKEGWVWVGDVIAKARAIEGQS